MNISQNNSHNNQNNKNYGQNINQNEKLYKIRLTMAHVLACAVKQIFDEVRFGTGAVTEEGFYYDFELPGSLVYEDLKAIEEKTRDIINSEQQILNVSISLDEARRLFREQPYKLELINELAQKSGNPNVNKQINICRLGDFIDLCSSPHLASLKELNSKAFKLMSFSGAYWEGDAEKPMLQRIHGTAWENPSELEAYINRVYEASKRDHRTLGNQLDLFSFSQNVGQGLVLWHPKGAMIRYLLEKFSQTAHILNGYDWVYTPHIGHSELWQTSGHLKHYKESMYNPIEIDNEEYYLKPMSCPFHVMIYNSP